MVRRSGLALGALLGFILGAVVVTTMQVDNRWQIVTVLGRGLGALFGAWVASMVGSAVPNSRLKQFESAIEEGRILVMADVPQHRVTEVREALHDRHPEAEDRGIDPHIPHSRNGRKFRASQRTKVSRAVYFPNSCWLRRGAHDTIDPIDPPRKARDGPSLFAHKKLERVAPSRYARRSVTRGVPTESSSASSPVRSTPSPE